VPRRTHDAVAIRDNADQTIRATAHRPTHPRSHQHALLLVKCGDDISGSHALNRDAIDQRAGRETLIDHQVRDRPGLEERVTAGRGREGLHRPADNRRVTVVAIGLDDPDAEGREGGKVLPDPLGGLIDELGPVGDDERAAEHARLALRIEHGEEHLRLAGADRHDDNHAPHSLGPFGPHRIPAGPLIVPQAERQSVEVHRRRHRHIRTARWPFNRPRECSTRMARAFSVREARRTNRCHGSRPPWTSARPSTASWGQSQSAARRRRSRVNASN
jgi:hypothetical protein